MKRIGFVIMFLLMGCLVLGEKCVASEKRNPNLIIALDPGHGGSENGAEYFGLREQDVNYKLAKYVAQELSKYPSIRVMLTRQEEEEVTLEERARRATKADADILLSLHFNASGSHTAHGASIYLTTGSRYRENLMDLADCFLGEFESIGLANAGTFARVTQMGQRREDGTFDDYYGIIRHAYNRGLPAMIVEHCYMDSKVDKPFFDSEEGLQNLAIADARAIAAHFKLCDEDGDVVGATRAKHYMASDAAVTLDYYQAPQITGIGMVDYDGTTPGQIEYEVSVEDGVGVTYLYLIYKNVVTGERFIICPTLNKDMKTGKHFIKAYLPNNLECGRYQLCFIGANNAAGYDVAYNRIENQMIGFGGCEWQNQFELTEDVDFTVKNRLELEESIKQRIEKKMINTKRDCENSPFCLLLLE